MMVLSLYTVEGEYNNDRRLNRFLIYFLIGFGTDRFSNYSLLFIPSLLD